MTMTIEDLSPEMLVKIFSHYIESEGHVKFSRNVAPVCKTWWNHSSTPSLWKSFHAPDWNCLLSLSERKLLCYIQSLEIGGRGELPCSRVYLDSSQLLTVLSRIRDLKSLTIYSPAIHADTMVIVAEHCPNLEHLSMVGARLDREGPIPFEKLDLILATCGPKLKHLDFLFYEIGGGEQLIESIAANCTSLEVLEWQSLCCNFPIYKLAGGCLPLRKLKLLGCVIDTTGWNDCSGFKDLTEFSARNCDFKKFDVCSLLQNSSNLDDVKLDRNEGLVFRNISRVSSNKLRFFNVSLKHKWDIRLEDFQRAMNKWKHTLLHLKINHCRCDITSALKMFLDGNPCPKLEVLWINKKSVDQSFLETFRQKCQNLKELEFLHSKRRLLKQIGKRS